MISPPGATHIGERLTIAVLDSAGNTKELLGLLHSENTILRRDGTLSTFDPNSITHWRVVTKVTAKAGTGAPKSMRIHELEAVAAITSPANMTANLGKWILRATKGGSLPENSALPTGDRPFGEPGLELDAALLTVTNFFRENKLPSTIAVPLSAYSQLDEHLESQGWQVAADFTYLVIDTNEVQPITLDTSLTTQTATEPTPGWRAIEGDSTGESMRSYPANYLSIHINNQPISAGRIAFNGGWGVISKVFVNPNYRRQGIGRTLMYALADTARAHSYHKLALQVDSRNAPALSLFDSIGFRNHHSVRFRVLP